jgi:hypothetical protein
MNKLSIFILISLLIFSCGSNLKDGKICVKTIDGFGQESDVEFWVEDILVNELKISEDVLVSIGKTACRYSDWNIEDKNYFYIDNNRINMISFNKEKKVIKVWTHVVKSNFDGTQRYITNTFEFDLNGNVLYDETGDLSVYSYEY